jgi:hypothetical protein
MNERMRRRIERSRARCEKAAMNHKPDKTQEAKAAQPNEQTQAAQDDS